MQQIRKRQRQRHYPYQAGYKNGEIRSTAMTAIVSVEQKMLLPGNALANLQKNKPWVKSPSLTGSQRKGIYKAASRKFDNAKLIMNTSPGFRFFKLAKST
ncbi:hypothetical protein T08_14665 [Trichinella sp. T8]|nr:hypothetical protein T08_14665 [Trichinella sp. T8]